MGRFSREELLEAYRQMEKEREAERVRAEKAAKWLQKHCGLNVQATPPPPYVSSGFRDDVPYLPLFHLCISYCQYDQFNDWLKSRLVSPPEIIGISRGESGFRIDLGPAEGFPEVTSYYCYTSAYNAHEGGY